MSGYVLSVKARSDLEGIWIYSAEHWGIERAERYLRELWVAIESVSENPRRGSSCDAVRAGHFKILIGSHVILYRIRHKKVAVVRILHQRMDIPRHL